MLSWIWNTGAGADGMDTMRGNEVAGRQYSDSATSEEYYSKKFCNGLDYNDSPNLPQFKAEKVYTYTLQTISWMFGLVTNLFHELLASTFLFSYLLGFNLKH